MNGVLTEVLATAGASGHTLLRAHPRADRLHLEMADHRGRRVIGQWLPDATLAREVTRGTEEAAPGLARLHDRHLLVQRAGADRRLTVLPELVARGGDLVVHRPERRAVVRTTDDGRPRYTKVVRPRRTADLVRRMGTATRVPGLRVPHVVAADEADGTVGLSTLPGRPLHDLLAEPGGPGTEAARIVGETVLRLHSGLETAGPAVAGHDLDDEVRATRALIDLARAHRVVPATAAADLDRALVRAAGQVAAAGPMPRALLHRDLHDKQLLVDVDEVGVLDVDMLAAGDPALDLGNLLAHLDLRVAQGWTSRTVAAEVEEAVLAGYGPGPRLATATDGYRALTTVRLRALYAFRPADLPHGPLPRS